MAAPVPPAAPAVPLTPEQIAENEARRGRATLLRAFETTTLTRNNFCALKGLKDQVLEAQLVQARAERKSMPPPPPEREREAGRSHQHANQHAAHNAPYNAPRANDRGPRRDAPGRPAGPRSGKPSR